MKSHKVEIPSKKKEGLSDRTTVKGVINYIQKKMLKKNPEMFLKGENTHPPLERGKPATATRAGLWSRSRTPPTFSCHLRN